MTLKGRPQTILGKARAEVFSRINVHQPCYFNVRDAPWVKVRTMTDSDHKWDLSLGKEHAVQAEYGNLESGLDLAASPEHGRDPYRYRTNPQPGALFEADEFRLDGQRRLL